MNLIVASRVFVVGVVGVWLAACAPAPPVVKTGGADPSAVAAQKTFAFGTLEASMNGFDAGEVTPEVLAKVRAEVVEELTTKRYVEAKEGARADLTVYVAAGTRKTLEDRSTATMRLGASQTVGIQRGIAVDIMATGTTTPLFHGDARYDAELKTIDEAKIKAAVHEVLATVPASAK